MIKKPYTVGVTGGSGSGKSYFIDKLASFFSTAEITILPQDHYYFPIEKQAIDAAGVQNFDLPDAIDHQLFMEDLRKLQSGITVHRKEYTYNKPGSEANTLEFKPAPILLAEGLFLFNRAELAGMIDLRIYIDAKDHVKLARRIRRDRIERGYDLDDVLYRYENHVMPVYESVVSLQKDHADIIVTNNSSMDRAIGLFAEHLRARLHE